MKLLYSLLVLSPLTVAGQSLISYLPQQRTALLEDFTGIHCGYCPEGHVIAHDLETEDPEGVVVLGIHAGTYANPNPGEPDFRTTWGTAIDNFFPITGYPAGVVGRHTFPAGLAQGRGGWTDMVHELRTFSSPVNLGMSSSFDPNSRDLTVTVQWHYTADSPGNDDRITVLLKESHIIGWQTDYGNGNQPNYDHTNVFRECFTDTWGDVVTATTMGSSETRTYTYNVPMAFDIANCEVVAFIGEYQSDVYQAREVAADGGANVVISDMVADSPVYDAADQLNGAQFTFSVINYSGVDGPFDISLSSADAPLDWSAGFDIMGNSYGTSATVTLVDNALESLVTTITPGASPAVATYTLTLTSVNDPNAPVITEDFHVISGISDLVVTNPEAEPHEVLYTGGLQSAGQAARGATTRTHFIGFGDNNALDGVLNVYCNVSWTFPGLTEQVVAVLEDHLDNGGNMMIAGQDIGWDQSGDPGSNGTPITEAFYANYMHATFVADGSTANSSIDFIDADAVFGNEAGSAINSVFGTSSYPEEITPIAPAVPIFNYNGNASKIGGLRVQTNDYKVVYFGVGPEQMSDAAVAGRMVSLSHDWFYGLVSVAELDAAFQSPAYPVPADQQLFIPLHHVPSGSTMEVIDATGRMVHQTSVQAVAGTFTLNTRDLAPGVYTYRLVSSNGTSAGRSFTVAR